MKRNINQENYAHMQNKYIQRTWTFSAPETDGTPGSYDYWEITNNREFFDASTSHSRDLMSVETFLLQHSYDAQLFNLSKFHDFLSEREKIQIPPPGIDDETRKAYVLLNEAGSGKTTYLTWLARELFRGHCTRWIVKLKLIECSFVFSKYEQNETNDQTAALRLLFRLIYVHFLAPNINSKDIEYAKAAYKNAHKCSEVLKISNKGVELDTTKIAPNIACKMLVLLRIFRIKCERKQLFLLLDGFDEIVPTYKQTALALLSWLGGFEGICKLYLTSRPYGFSKDFEQALKSCLFYRLEKFLKGDILHHTYRFVLDKWKDSSEVNRFSLVGVLYVLARRVLVDVGENPLFLTIVLELLQNEIEKHVDLDAGQISHGLMQECQKMFEPMRMMEIFVKKKLNISNLEKTSASVGIFVAPVAIMMRDKAYKKILTIHSILAMYLLFEEKTVETLLTDEMRKKALKYMKKIQNGLEKSGIIEGVVSNTPLFIHRLFAEYFAALWLFSNRDHEGVKEFVKELMYGENRKEEIRYFLNRMVCRDTPFHMAILDRSNGKIEELFKTNKECVNEKDLWGRTPLHLAFGENWEGKDLHFRTFDEGLKLLLDMTDVRKIDATDDYFGWSTLYYAGVGFFHTRSINLAEQDKIFAHLNSEDPVEIFYCALAIEKKLAPNILYYIYSAKTVFQPLFQCIARKLINEKHFDLHTSIFIKEGTTRNDRYKDLLRHLEYYPFNYTPLGYCVHFDSILLKLLVDAAGGPEKVLSSVAPELLRKGCERRSFIVLRYLIIDCKFQLPSIKNYRQVLTFLCVYMTADKHIFRDLFDKYCRQYNIVCLDEDQLREPEMIDENDTYAIDGFRKILTLRTWDIPNKPYVLENGIDEGTYLLLKMALDAHNVKIFQYLILKTDIAIDTAFITALLSDLNDADEKWSCAFHFLHKMIKNLLDELENGQNLLHAACTKRWFRLVRCLMECFNFDPFRENKRENNWNAFFYCVQVYGNVEIFDYLMKKYDMDRFGKLDSKRKSVFYYAVQKDWIIAMSILRKEFDAELNDLNHEQISRLTSLLKTSGFDVAEMFEFLENRCLFDALKLETVCNTLRITEDSVFCDEGRNLLHIACTMGWFELVKCLLAHFSFDALRENERENNWNAFFYCVFYNTFHFSKNAEVFTYLAGKCDMDFFGKKDSNGKSVFNYALEGVGQIACSIMYKEFSVRNVKSIPERSACLLKRLEEAKVKKEDFSENLKRLERTAGPKNGFRVDVLPMKQILSYCTS